jgi:hypothetical protein
MSAASPRPRSRSPTNYKSRPGIPYLLLDGRLENVPTTYRLPGKLWERRITPKSSPLCRGDPQRSQATRCFHPAVDELKLAAGEEACAVVKASDVMVGIDG